MIRLTRWLAAIAAPLLLASCILTPAKFVSTLDIRADRTFTLPGEGEPTRLNIAARSGFAPRARRIAARDDFSDTQDEVAQLNALAEALSKEYGFRSVKYIGNRKLAIDYAVTGKLDHAFVFPFNPDADVLLPFIAIELRGKDKVRVKAPGYASQQSMSASLGGLGGMPAMGADADASSGLDGTFTLTTNADDRQPEPGGRRPDAAQWREEDRLAGHAADQGSADGSAAARSPALSAIRSQSPAKLHAPPRGKLKSCRCIRP